RPRQVSTWLWFAAVRLALRRLLRPAHGGRHHLHNPSDHPILLRAKDVYSGDCHNGWKVKKVARPARCSGNMQPGCTALRVNRRDTEALTECLACTSSLLRV